MGIPERKRRTRQDLRKKILRAAEALFVKNGFENVSMRGIARRIEYSPTTIYHCFRNKGELFACLLESYQAKLLGVMEEIYGRGDDPVTTLKHGMRAYTEFGLANPSWYRLSFMSPPVFKAESYLAEGEKGTELYMKLRAHVGKCISLGLFLRMDVDVATQTVWTMNHGVTSLLITNPNFPWAARNVLIQRVINSAIRGLSAVKEGR